MPAQKNLGQNLFIYHFLQEKSAYTKHTTFRKHGLQIRRVFGWAYYEKCIFENLAFGQETHWFG